MQFDDRIVQFEGIQNFRDFGGYLARGGRLHPQRFYRSAHLGEATDADIAMLGDFDFAHVVDLRRPAERARNPSRLPSSFSGNILSSDQGPEGHAPHLAFVGRALTSADAQQIMENFYADAVFDPVQADLARQHFRHLADGEGRVLIHCAAGKDRTGCLVALTQASVGVHDDDILEDYLRTNAAMRIDTRLPELTRVLTDIYAQDLNEHVVRSFLFVDERYLAKSLRTIRDRSGTIDQYFRDYLGIDSAQLARIEARLVA